MGKHNWEYHIDSKVYKIQSLSEFNGESRTYYINRAHTLDVNPKLGKFKEVKKDLFIFFWSKFTRRITKINDKIYDKQRCQRI